MTASAPLVVLLCAAVAACGVTDPRQCEDLLDEMVASSTVAVREEARQIHGAVCSPLEIDPSRVRVELDFNLLVVNPDHLSRVMRFVSTDDSVLDRLPPINGIPARQIFDPFLQNGPLGREAPLAPIYARFAAGDPRLHYNHLAIIRADLELWRGSQRIARAPYSALRTGRRVIATLAARDVERWERGDSDGPRWLVRAMTRSLERPPPPHLPPPTHCRRNAEPRALAYSAGEAVCFTHFDTLSDLLHVDPTLSMLVFAEIGASFALNEWVVIRWRRLRAHS